LLCSAHPGAQEHGAFVVRVRQIKGGFGETLQGIWGDTPGDLGRHSRGFGETKNETILGESMVWILLDFLDFQKDF
jgi:hypothetical protein